jgi:hypothetical protein
MMKAFLDSLSSIPKELWTPLGTLAAGIFTAFVAFTAVVLQNMAAGRRHRQELRHDAIQRELERASELRKIVYLDALDSLAQSSALMSDVWNMNISEEELSDSVKQKLKIVSGRLSAVANLDTIRALDEVNRAGLEMVKTVASLRISHASVKQSEGRLKDFFEKAVKQRNEAAAKIADSKDLAEEQRKALEEEHGRLQTLAGEGAAKLLDAVLHRLNAVLEIQMLGVERKVKFDRAMWRLTLAIRQELGFKIDEKAFSELMENSAQHTADTFRAITKEVRAGMEKEEKKFQEQIESRE